MNGWEATGAIGSVVAGGAASWAAFLSRSSAREANEAAKTLTRIEVDRRQSELCPRFRVSCEKPGPGDYHGVLRLRVLLVGPHALKQLDNLTLTIRDDLHRRADRSRSSIDPSREDIARQIWGPYRFTPSTGPDDARADDTGRVTPYDATLPVGEALVYQLEPNPQPSWSTGTTQQQWQQQQGTAIRLAFDAVSAEFGSWRLTCELDVGNSGDRVVVDVV